MNFKSFMDRPSRRKVIYLKKNTSKIHAENVPTEVVSASVQLRT